uniref:Ion_trans_2 domain-containing protein n=1 Tax=Parastrongyloides trichosuri TaxID=131310 RepID=A0A0N4ZLA9_PARTI
MDSSRKEKNPSNDDVDQLVETYDIIKFRLYIYFNAVILTLLIGAAVYYSLEGNISIDKEQEYDNRCKSEKFRLEETLRSEIDFLKKSFPTKTIAEVFDNDNLYHKFRTLIIQMDSCHRHLNISKVKELNFVTSFSFVYSIMSTVGYGDVIPYTIPGKLFLVLFSIITIPLFITFYIEFSEIITIKLIKAYIGLYNKVHMKIGIIGKEVSSTTVMKDQETYQTSKAIISLLAFIVVVFTTCILHYQITSTTPQPEDFMSSLLFVFESIALIGLGYNVPEDTIKYIFIELPFIIIGVSFFGLYINIIVNFLRHTLPTFISRRYHIRGSTATGDLQFIDYILKRRKVKFAGITSDYRSDVYVRNNLEACTGHYS